MYILTEVVPLKNLLSKDLNAINHASEIAEKSIFDKSKRLGAVLTCKGNNYVGENQHREKYGKIFHRSLHAEMHALLKSVKMNRQNRIVNKKNNVPKMTIYVVRICAIPKLYGNAKPCETCQKFLYFYNVQKIKYTDNINGVNVLCTMKMI
jgi:hypothetical protein